MSKDIPVIFSAPMVRALLEGRKTMTRRILKPQPVPFAIDVGKECEVGLLHVDGESRPRVMLGRVVTKQEVRFAVGDRLWVREDFTYVGTCDPGFLTYQATYPQDLAKYGLENVPAKLQAAGYKWKPSIHMPRNLSRLTLIVTGVKVERLQEISNDDAKAEGVDAISMMDVPRQAAWSHRGDFAQLWDRIHGDEAWRANPFVVAVTFRIIKANIDAAEAGLAA